MEHPEGSKTTKEIKEGQRMTVYQPSKRSTTNQKDIERGAEARRDSSERRIRCRQRTN